MKGALQVEPRLVGLVTELATAYNNAFGKDENSAVCQLTNTLWDWNWCLTFRVSQERKAYDEVIKRVTDSDGKPIRGLESRRAEANFRDNNAAGGADSSAGAVVSDATSGAGAAVSGADSGFDYGFAYGTGYPVDFGTPSAQPDVATGVSSGVSSGANFPTSGAGFPADFGATGVNHGVDLGADLPIDPATAAAAGVGHGANSGADTSANFGGVPRDSATN